MRILVTGSRDWDNRSLLYMALTWEAGVPGVTLVHGDCPTGADAMADAWGKSQGDVEIEPHPADWSLGRRAGPERNKYMVSLGADVCLAFIGSCSSPRCKIDGDHPSHGASGTADMAEAAGIPTRRFYA